MEAKARHKQLIEEVQTAINEAIDRRPQILILSSEVGFGKTFWLNATLKQRNLKKFDWNTIENQTIHQYDYAASTVEIDSKNTLRTIYSHPDKILLFDYFDSKKSMNMLRKLFDQSSSNEEGEIVFYNNYKKLKSYTKDSIPSTIAFTGSIIITTRVPVDKIPDAIKGLSKVIDMKLSKHEYLEWLSDIYLNLEFSNSKDVSKETRKRALDFIYKLSDRLPVTSLIPFKLILLMQSMNRDENMGKEKLLEKYGSNYKAYLEKMYYTLFP